METLRRRRPLLFIIMVLLLLLILWIFVQPPQTSPSAFECRPGEIQPAEITLKTGEFYVQGQVIVTGPAGDIEQVIREVEASLDISLITLFDCHLGYLAELPADLERIDPFATVLPEGGQDDLTTQLFQFEGLDSQDVATVVATINQIGSERNVFADPNYLISPNPWGVEGDPWGVEGDPWGVEGDPGDPDPTGTSRLAFCNQWAFGAELGIGLTVEGECPELGGENVRIGVFDTSPFTQTGPVILDYILPQLVLESQHPFTSNDLSYASTHSRLAEHGLFVASLAHAVAPQSEIYLIRVLNDLAVGDLFTLNAALHQFIIDMRDPETGRLEDVVLNLSLGVHPSTLSPESADTTQDETGAARDPYEIDQEIESLQTVLSVADRLGGVIVAAAGNDSAVNGPLGMQIPAGYSFVIGVSASTQDRNRACYANTGDVGAPGGEGGPDESSETACAPQVSQCPIDPDQPGACEYGVIGLVTSTSPSDTGYAYWVGTSFSTPMVSGLAARILGTGIPPGNVPTVIYNGVRPSPDSTLGAGVVYLPTTPP